MTNTPLPPMPAVAIKTAADAQQSKTTAANVTVRLATTADADSISKLGVAVFYATFSESGPTPEQMQNFLSSNYSPAAITALIAEPKRTVFVACTPAGQVVGFAMMGRDVTEDCIAPYDPAPELQKLYIDKNFHGAGVAKALCAEIEQLARSEGYRHIWLGVWEGNHRAKRFYEKLQYRKVGEHGFDVGGDISTDWVMVKDL